MNHDLHNVINDLIVFYNDLYVSYMHNENYDKIIKEEIINILNIQFDSFDFKKHINSCYDDAFNYFIKNSLPRCSGNSFEKEIQFDKIKKTLDDLENIYQPAQKTNEWYEFRCNFITASNAWKAFGTNSQKNQLIYEKCLPLNLEKYKPNFSESPLTWGIKYEDVSILIYEELYNTKVKDYGCIPHKNYSFLAASPDGINNVSNTSRYGRMLEIKNIVNRKINGNPKLEYWIQMQLQMEVCDLDECDFLETKFIEYDNYNDFIKDGTFTKTENNKQKGVLLYFGSDKGPYYEYAPLNVEEDELNIWIENKKTKHSDKTWINTIYWKLEIISCVLVIRNREWFKHAVKDLNNIWETIINDRKNGYEHRAPKKQNKKECKTEKNKCLIEIDC